MARNITVTRNPDRQELLTIERELARRLRGPQRSKLQARRAISYHLVSALLLTSGIRLVKSPSQRFVNIEPK